MNREREEGRFSTYGIQGVMLPETFFKKARLFFRETEFFARWGSISAFLFILHACRDPFFFCCS
jgi:hypothetical protein